MAVPAQKGNEPGKEACYQQLAELLFETKEARPGMPEHALIFVQLPE